MTPEPIESNATASQAHSRQNRRVPMIDVNSASRSGETSNTMAIPVYSPLSLYMFQPEHDDDDRATTEVDLDGWLHAQSVLVAATSPDQKPTTTEAEGTSPQSHSFLFPCPYPMAPPSPVIPVVAGSLVLQKSPFPSKSRPCQLASHLHLHPSFILSALSALRS